MAGAKQPFSYQGGKLKELGKITNILGKNISICEPFLGSGIIVGNLGKENDCVTNELNKDVYSIWANAYDEKFLSLIRQYCQEENRFADYYYGKREEYNVLWREGIYNIERSALFYYIMNSCHAGLLRYGKKGFNASFKLFLLTGRKYNIEEKIPILHNFRSKMKIVHNMNALELLKTKLDVSVIYCDPPYTSTVENYERTWTDDNYVELIDLLKFQYSKYGIPSLVSNYSNDKFNHLFDNITHFKTSRMASTKVVEKDDILGFIGMKQKTNLEDFYENS